MEPVDKVRKIQSEALELFEQKNQQHGMLSQNTELLEL